MISITIQAIYRDGILEPQEKLDLPDNTPVQVQVTPMPSTPVQGDSLFGTFPELAQLEVGSPGAVLAHAGTLHFEPGELDRLLADINQMRSLDLESYA